MARNANSKKSGTRKKNTKKRSHTKKQLGFLSKEMIVWTLLGFCVLYFISNLGLGGFIGRFLSRSFFALFGWMSYITPLLLFFLVLFVAANGFKKKVNQKIIGGSLSYLSLTLLLQLMDGKGGLLGGTLEKILSPAIGMVGTYLFTILFLIISIVILTGKSALEILHTQGKAFYRHSRGYAKQFQQRRREREEKRRREMPKLLPEEELPWEGFPSEEEKVSGVSFDTNLKEVESFISKEENRIEDIDLGEEAVIEEKSQNKRKKHLKEEDAKKEMEEVEKEVKKKETTEPSSYMTPPLRLLKKGRVTSGESASSIRETSVKLQQTLKTFGVNVTITNVSCGPTVTRYELQPEMGVKVSKIVGLSDDIKLNLAASDIRIEAPIPGKAAVGIEIPNKENSAVMLRDLIESQEFQQSDSNLSFAAGKDIGGRPVIADLAKMPHVLIAGATGSGKSVCINTLIISLLYKASPEDVKLIMIDPKVVELSVYNDIPHLMIPVVTDPKKAAGALNWAVAEMTRRYQAFSMWNVRNIAGYNEAIRTAKEEVEQPEKMPQIVIIVDELADLMMVAPGDVEEAICRLAQLARAAGIHLVLATQRPSVNVITGLIKANMPSRIAFSVSSGVDSRTIIDMNGAEKLLGKGDMLYYPTGYQKPARVQGAFVSDQEVQEVVSFLKSKHGETRYDEEVISKVNAEGLGERVEISGSEEGRDAYFIEAGRLIIEKEKASIGMLQRAFKIGFNRAARIMDQLFEIGVVGPEEGTKPRKVLMSLEEFDDFVKEIEPS